VEHLKGALPVNIRVGWKGLPRTNTVASYGNPQITAMKSFIIQAQGSMLKNNVVIYPGASSL
jgi:hypothetical protein